MAMPVLGAVIAGASLVLTGFLAGYVTGTYLHLGSLTPRSPSPSGNARPSPSPSPKVALGCNGAPVLANDIPLPASSRLLTTNPSGSTQTYHVDWGPYQVALWYDNGADQEVYLFQGNLATTAPWRYLFRNSKDPACRGVITIRVDPTGSTTLLDISLSTDADAIDLATATPPLPLPCNGVQGELGDFPEYPGSWAVGTTAAGTGEVWHVNASPAVVANFYKNGASQVEYAVHLDAQTPTVWSYTWWRQADPSCWGNVMVNVDPTGQGTLVEFTISRARGSRPPNLPSSTP